MHANTQAHVRSFIGKIIFSAETMTLKILLYLKFDELIQ